MQWLLFSYRAPVQPSALRVAVWRELKQMGAVGLGSGLYGLPDRAEYGEALARLTRRLTEGGGSGIAFRATALGEEDGRAIAEAFEAARQEEYLQVQKSARKLVDHIGREEDEHDFRLAEVDSLEEELDKVRRQLARVARRDPGRAPARTLADGAIAAAEARLQRYLERAYQETEADADATTEVMEEARR